MKVFYSWQSDTPAKVNRTFIREALEAALQDLELEDAERPELDQDTKGVLGSPVIADTIFKKINAANVVVADVTLTGTTPAGKRLCNSNVAIELGYALGVHGDGVLLKVMNTHYGPPADLPFDLAHRRWPVQYRLNPEDQKAERQTVRVELAKELKAILDAYIAAQRPASEVFTPTPSTYNSGAYWQKDEKLGTTSLVGQGSADLSYGDKQPLIYLRIWPGGKIPTLTSKTLSDFNKASIEPLCGTIDGWSNERNRYGVMSYAYSHRDRVLISTTQILKNGEIWGVNAHLLRKEEGYPDFLPTSAYERALRTSLITYLKAARQYFGYPSTVHVESGLVNVEGFKLALPGKRYWGPIFEDVKVKTQLDTDQPATITQALLKIFEAAFDAAGTPRPTNYDNFPASA